MRALLRAAALLAGAAAAHAQPAVDLWVSGEDMRNYDRSRETRQVALSDDGGASWHSQRHEPALIEPVCQASIRRLRWPEGDRPGAIAFSNPASRERRERMTIRLSLDEARTWSSGTLVDAGFAAYSSLVAIDDAALRLLYEGGTPDGDYGRITFVRYGLDELAGRP